MYIIYKLKKQVFYKNKSCISIKKVYNKINNIILKII